MAVGHQVAGGFPALDVAGGNGPGGAGQLAFAGEELLIDRRAEDGEALAPLLDFGEFLARHLAGEEEILRLLAEALDHVLLGGIVIVAGGDGVAVHFERGKELEHLLDLLDIGFLIDGRVGGDLVAENLGHADGLDAFLEHAFTLDDEVVGVFQAVHVNIPVQPFAGRMGGRPSLLAFANGFGVFVGDQFFGEQPGESRFQRGSVNAGEVIPQLTPHEQAVGADIDDAALAQQAGDEFLDLRVDQGFAAANRDHRRSAVLSRGEAILQGHHVLEAGGVFTDAAAAGAGQVAGMQRFEREDQRESGRSPDFVLDNVPGDLNRQREREPHNKSLGFTWLR